MLLCIAILLGVWLYHQWFKDITNDYSIDSSMNSATSAEYELATVLPFQPMPFANLGEITQRPLFTEGRIPPEKPKKEQQVKVHAAPLKLKLEGVVLSPESKVAIITDLQTKQLLRLSQGMSHANWKVVEVNEHSVTIQQGVKEIVLTLELDETSGPAGKGPKTPFKLPSRPPVRR